MKSPHRSIWVVGLVAVGAGWVFGLWVWGAPGSEPAGAPVEQLMVLALVGVPSMLLAGTSTGFGAGGSRASRWLGLAGWTAGMLALAWVTSFVHFGGVCMGPGDVCTVRWPGRIVGLLVAIGLVVGGSALSVAIDRRRRAVAAEQERRLDVVLEQFDRGET